MPDSMVNLLPLVEQLYDAAAGRGEWQGFLADLAGALRGVIPGLFVHDRPTEPATLRVTAGMDPAWGAPHDRYYGTHTLPPPKIWTLPTSSLFAGTAHAPTRPPQR